MRKSGQTEPRQNDCIVKGKSKPEILDLSIVFSPRFAGPFSKFPQLFP